MNFQDYLATLPSVAHLSGLNVCDKNGVVVQHIPNAVGKMGSLRVYYALLQQFDGKLDAQSATQGLIWFAEHVTDAKNHVGKHPNIDLLLKVQKQNLAYQLQAVLVNGHSTDTQ